MICAKEALYWGIRKLHNYPVLSGEERDGRCQEKIKQRKPFLSGKIGGNELWALRTAEFGYWEKIDELWQSFTIGAGFFFEGEKKTGIIRFCDHMKEAISLLDQAVEWQKPKEYYFFKKYRGGMPELVGWVGIDPKMLKGRKVLVVHPFEKTIRYQYERRKKIFDDPEKLPDMDLSIVKAVQTIGGNADPRFKDWFEALDYMTEEVFSKDFDIALVGCGAYGLPLAARIKKAGKVVIHLGGELQLLFGIRGKRWIEDPNHEKRMNEFWIHPLPEDVPENYEMVEGGCYW